MSVRKIFHRKHHSAALYRWGEQLVWRCRRTQRKLAGVGCSAKRLKENLLHRTHTLCDPTTTISTTTPMTKGFQPGCERLNSGRFLMRTIPASKLFLSQHRPSGTCPLLTKSSPLRSLLAKIEASDDVSLQPPSHFSRQLPASPPITPPMSLPTTVSTTITTASAKRFSLAANFCIVCVAQGTTEDTIGVALVSLDRIGASG